MTFFLQMRHDQALPVQCLKHGKYFMLKGVGNDIWDLLEENILVNDIINKLLEEYEVEEDECVDSTLKFLGQLEELDFIEGGA